MERMDAYIGMNPVDFLRFEQYGKPAINKNNLLKSLYYRD
jgi:hypothetical protein